MKTPWYIKQLNKPVIGNGITFDFKVNKWWVRLRFIQLFFKKLTTIKI